MSGTSMAAPHITGLISAMLRVHPNLTTSDIKNIFKTSGEIVNTPIEKKMGKFADADIVLQNLMSTSMQTQTGVILPLANTGAVLSTQDISVLDSTIQPLAPETNSGTTNTGSSSIQQEIPVINLNPNGEVHTSSDDASPWRTLPLTQENGDHPETLLLNPL